MKTIRQSILLVLLLLTSVAGYAEGIFSSTYGEKWVTIVAKSNCAYYLSYKSYSGTEQICFAQTDANSVTDSEKWCLVGSASNFQLYNKEKGEKYVVDAPASAADNGFISFVSSNTGHLVLGTSGGGYNITPSGTGEYWNLLGGGAEWDFHIGYWNSATEDNALWVIEEYTGQTVSYSDAGSTLSKNGYGLVFSSETPETASQFLDLTDGEKANCKSCFTGQTSLEQTWEYCPLASATWNKRMGKDLKEKRQNIAYSGELLKLYAKTVTSASDGTSKFLTSGVQSLSSYKYGIFEIKAKTNGHTGNFPALWFMPDAFRKGTDRGWPSCGEIDLMEMVNKSYAAHGTVHNANCTCNGGSGNYTASIEADGNYHIYTLKWTTDSLAWYIDGKQFYSYVKDKSLSGTDLLNQYPFDKPYYIILNQSVGAGGWAANPDETYTYEMDVAYVRVYQQGSADASLHLTDDDPALIEGKYKEGNISYTRSANNFYSGFYVPFDVDLSTMTDNFKEVYIPLDSAVYNPSTGVLTTIFNKYDMTKVLPAYTPFLAVMTTDDSGAKKSQTVCLTSVTETTISETADRSPAEMRVRDLGTDGSFTPSTTYSVKYGGSLNKSVHGQTEGYYIPYGTKLNWGAVTTLMAFRDYIKVQTIGTASKTPTFAIELIDDPTSIAKVQPTAPTDAIYDLNGRLLPAQTLGSLPQGIYIKDGKKYIITRSVGCSPSAYRANQEKQ